MVSLYPLDEEWKLDMDVSVRKLVKNSPKLAVLMGLVTNACDDGNR